MDSANNLKINNSGGKINISNAITSGNYEPNITPEETEILNNFSYEDFISAQDAYLSALNSFNNTINKAQQDINKNYADDTSKEARINLIEDGMMKTINNTTLKITLNENLKGNTDYVFSVEYTSSASTLSVCYGTTTSTVLTSGITNTNSYMSCKFKTSSSQTGKTITIKSSLSNINLYGVKLAKGSKYTGYESSPAEREAMSRIQTAMNGTTDINGGLMLTNLIGMKGSDGKINGGISGLETGNTAIRFWAGAGWTSATTAPFRVYNDGRVFATRFYGFNSAFKINANDTKCYTADDNGYYDINWDYTGSSLWISDSDIASKLKLPTIRNDKDGTNTLYTSTIEIYNPNRCNLTKLAKSLGNFKLCTSMNFLEEMEVSQSLINLGYTVPKPSNWTFINNRSFQLWSIGNSSFWNINNNNLTLNPSYLRLRCFNTSFDKNFYGTGSTLTIKNFPEFLQERYASENTDKFYFVCWFLEDMTTDGYQNVSGYGGSNFRKNNTLRITDLEKEVEDLGKELEELKKTVKSLSS